MSDAVVWRDIYGKPTAFLGGLAAGDCYLSKGTEEGDVWRLRVWKDGRVEGGQQWYALPPEGVDPKAFAKQQLVARIETANQERGE